MRILSVLIIHLFFALGSTGQTAIKFRSGAYTTSDGNYTIQIENKNGKLIIVEPNKQSEYQSLGNNTYGYINPKNGLKYKMIVKNDTAMTSYSSSGNAKTELYFSGNTYEPKTEEAVEEATNLTTKYRKKMETDLKDGQLWAFCAAAAMQKGTLNEEGFSEYAGAVILAMRQLLIDQSKCPCEDVIPDAMWQSVK